MSFIAAADAGLIADDEPSAAAAPWPRIKPSKKFQGRNKLVRAIDITVIHIDHAVTVELESAQAILGCREKIKRFLTLCARSATDQNEDPS